MNINLFAGAGGLAIGLSTVGFRRWRLYEVEEDPCETLRENIRRGDGPLSGSVYQTSVTEVDWRELRGRVRLLAGGVPCAPFSWAGSGNGHADSRNMFPEMLRAFRDLEPDAALIENVHGIRRPAFQQYFDYILRQLRNPSVSLGSHETWQSHDKRLIHTEKGSRWSPEYRVRWSVMNAADFGVPQERKRVFFVATRAELSEFEFPKPTHSRSVLLRDLRGGSYWMRNGLERPLRVRTPHFSSKPASDSLAWKTVREAISDLPFPSREPEGTSFNHWRIPGGKTYPGHTGSRMDWPSKTVKAGVHWNPGGENILRLKHGRVRYYTPREMARLQSFPDNHVFFGSSNAKILKQIGNAVPCLLATVLACRLCEVF